MMPIEVTGGSSRKKICGLSIVTVTLAATISVYYFFHSFQTAYLNQFQNITNAVAVDVEDINNEGRSAYGYRYPRPPWAPIRHVSHHCTIRSWIPSASGEHDEQISIPTAVPHLILIGAQKSGTSTLQKIFQGHKHVIKPSKKRSFEPHFFDWEMGIRMGKQYHNATEDVLCKFRKAYSEYYDLSEIEPNVSVVFEKTPSYMVWPDIPVAMEAVTGPWKPKVLAILRNPIDRAWSQYWMDNGRNKNARPFSDFMNKEISLFRRCGILERVTLTFEEFEHSGGGSNPFQFRENVTLQEYAWMLRDYPGDRLKGLLYRGLYALLLHPWVEQLAPEDRLMILRFEPFMEAENEHDRTIVNDVLSFAGLGTNYTDSTNLQRENHTIQTRMRRNRRRRKLLRANIGSYKKSIPPRMRQYLNMFYQPFNDLLAELLGEEWRDVWT